MGENFFQHEILMLLKQEILLCSKRAMCYVIQIGEFWCSFILMLYARKLLHHRCLSEFHCNKNKNFPCNKCKNSKKILGFEHESLPGYDKCANW